jgi:hypothetical protein
MLLNFPESKRLSKNNYNGTKSRRRIFPFSRPVTKIFRPPETIRRSR